MTTQYWLVKSEPETYAWTDLVRDGKTDWTGVRNFAARNHLRAMSVGDSVFFYHSGESKTIVGLAKVTRAAYPDPTAKEGDWVAVELSAVAPLKNPVSLEAVKAEQALADMALLRISRLSVQPVKPAEFKRLAKLGGL